MDQENNTPPKKEPSINDKEETEAETKGLVGPLSTIEPDHIFLSPKGYKTNNSNEALIEETTITSSSLQNNFQKHNLPDAHAPTDLSILLQEDLATSNKPSQETIIDKNKVPIVFQESLIISPLTNSTLETAPISVPVTEELTEKQPLTKLAYLHSATPTANLNTTPSEPIKVKKPRRPRKPKQLTNITTPSITEQTKIIENPPVDSVTLAEPAIDHLKPCQHSDNPKFFHS